MGLVLVYVVYSILSNSHWSTLSHFLFGLIVLLERSVLRTKEARDKDLTAVKADSRDELEKAIVMKMKSVTNADESVCIALLEDNNYDVKTSIEAFFQSS
jgi:hypothetical protein